MTSDLEISQRGSPSDHAPTGPATVGPPPVLGVRSWSFPVVAMTMIGLMVAPQLIDQPLKPAGIVGLELARTHHPVGLEQEGRNHAGPPLGAGRLPVRRRLLAPADLTLPRCRKWHRRAGRATSLGLPLRESGPILSGIASKCLRRMP